MKSTFRRQLLLRSIDIICLLVSIIIFHSLMLKTDGASCVIPPQFQGDFFSIELGDDVDTVINPTQMTVVTKASGLTTVFDCVDRWDDNTTLDANGNHNSKLLVTADKSNCYRCYYMFYQTPNIVQYKHRKGPVTVNCKNTVEGVYHFTYEVDVGGGGICDSPYSQITACQEPGSQYVDNQVFTMNFAKCPDVSTSVNNHIRFQCMGSWTDAEGNVWSGVADLGRDVYRERFRCLLTRYDQEYTNNIRRYTMSWWAECSSLKSPYDGPIRLVVEPSIGAFHKDYLQPECNFPKNSSGHWYHMSENDVDVDINTTHIYFKTKLDQYLYRESYFICMMTSGTRYLTVAITVGKCEIDFVCFDLLPRHHSIVRWRMGKPYRMTDIEKQYPNYRMNMFRQACTWSSFTINRNDIHWNYKTFLLNPPVPVPCPVRGRYTFTQSGAETELLTTRIRGMTERPRHNIDCKDYVAEAKSCEDNPTMLRLDAEYCATVDHTGRPIGEYDVPDWELACVGYWDEDWNSYMVTWDPEDATSAFRCWNYERADWRHIWMTRSTAAYCRPTMLSHGSTTEDGAGLALQLTEMERQYDDCPRSYTDKRNIPRDTLNSANSFIRRCPIGSRFLVVIITLGFIFVSRHIMPLSV